MAYDPTPPTFVADKLCWDVRGLDYEVTFWVSATAWKYVLGLGPRNRGDHQKAEDAARRNWPILELIARDALTLGKASENRGSKDWHIHYDIDRDAFMQIAAQYEQQLVS